MPKEKIFDWIKAAEIIAQKQPVEAAGGWMETPQCPSYWKWSAVTIWKDGELYENAFHIAETLGGTIVIKYRMPDSSEWIAEPCELFKEDAPEGWVGKRVWPDGETSDVCVHWPQSARDHLEYLNMKLQARNGKISAGSDG